MAEGVKTALRTLRLFQVYAKLKSPLPLSELARRLEMPLSSCHALVRTLIEKGFLYEVDRRSGYYPTARMLHYAQEVMAHDPLLQRLAGQLRALRDDCGETVVLARQQDGKALYLCVFESPRTVRFTATAGDLRPLHAAAAGKALLDTLPAAEQQALLARAGMKAYTPKTLTTFAALQEDLARARKRGWYTSVGETVDDAMAIGMPLRTQAGWFAVSVVGPISRVKAEQAQHVQRLRALCEAEGLGAQDESQALALQDE